MIAAGSRLGPYEILASLGAGGMGEVYRGRDTRLERQVAIKILAPHLSGDGDFKLRFEREARVISALNHPNICTVHDLGESDGRGYLVMELCEGESLAERLSRGPLPVDQLLQYATQIADALDRAHRSGIVHRDLKPGNIMLTKSGAKLLDFGLAKPTLIVGIDGPSVIDQSTHQRPLTAEGSIVGTFQYMAPEQFEGEPADARSDIFAFGCVLYEMATGRRPFDGKTRASLIASIMEREPEPISAVVPLMPPALQRVIKTALAKDPEDRWQSAHDLLLELRWIAEAGSQAGVAAPLVIRRKHRERMAWSLAAVAGVLAIAAGTLLWKEYAKPRQSFALNIAPNRGTTLMLSDANSGALTVSPDGRYVTFCAVDEGGKPQLWLRPVDSPVATPLAGTDHANFPFWSPDSRFIAFFAGDKLKKIAIAGGPPLSLAPVQLNPRSGSWNRDGVIVFSPNSLASIHKVSAAGGPVTPVTSLSASETTHRWASFLPDGKHFVYLAGSHGAQNDSESNAVYVSSIDGMKPKQILRARSNALYSRGHLLYVRDRVLMAQPFDLEKLELKGDPRPVAADLQYDGGFFRGSFAVSDGGTLVYRTGNTEPRLDMMFVDRQGNKLAAVGEPADWSGIALAPDGKSIAGPIYDHVTGASNLWIYDVERNIRTRFSFETVAAFDPVWSPDGKAVVFGGIRHQVGDLFVKPVSGTVREELLYASGNNKRPTDWSPDGRYVTFSEFDSKRQRSSIWLLPMQGDRKPVEFMATQYNVQNMKFSPDGRFALYRSDESGTNEYYVVPFHGSGGKWQVSQGGAIWATWANKGREILYSGANASLFAVDVSYHDTSVKIGTPRLLYRDPLVDYLAVAGENRLLVVRRPERKAEEPVTVLTDWQSSAGPGV